MDELQNLMIDRKGTEMKKIRKIAAAVAIIFWLCGGIFLVTRYYYSKNVKTVEVIKEVPVEKIVETEVQISGETIRANIANIGKLCTAEYNYTHVEQYDSSKKVKGYEIPFTSSSFIYSYDGVITAGIDFSKIQVKKDDTQKVITITLPDVEIISSDVDQDSFQLYDEKNNIFNPIHVTDVTDSFAALKNSEEAKARDDGLLDKAKENAKTIIENFMYSSYDIEGYKINILFDSGK